MLSGVSGGRGDMKAKVRLVVPCGEPLELLSVGGVLPGIGIVQ